MATGKPVFVFFPPVIHSHLHADPTKRVQGRQARRTAARDRVLCVGPNRVRVRSGPRSEGCQDAIGPVYRPVSARSQTVGGFAKTGVLIDYRERRNDTYKCLVVFKSRIVCEHTSHGTFSLDRLTRQSRFVPVVAQLRGTERIHKLTLNSIVLHLDSTVGDREIQTQQAKTVKPILHTMYRRLNGFS